MSAISTDRLAERTLCMVENPGYGGISTLGYCATIVTRGQRRAAQGLDAAVDRASLQKAALPPDDLEAMADMQRIGAAFGLTPSGRLRLSGIKPPGPIKFDGLLGGS
jgi:hypothetical protein